MNIQSSDWICDYGSWEGPDWSLAPRWPWGREHIEFLKYLLAAEQVPIDRYFAQNLLLIFGSSTQVTVWSTHNLLRFLCARVCSLAVSVRVDQFSGASVRCLCRQPSVVYLVSVFQHEHEDGPTTVSVVWSTFHFISFICISICIFLNCSCRQYFVSYFSAQYLIFFCPILDFSATFVIFYLLHT